MMEISQLYRKSARLEAVIVQEFMACAEKEDAFSDWLGKYLSDEMHDQYLSVLEKLKDQVQEDGGNVADPSCMCEYSSGEGEIEGIEYNNYTALRFIYPQNREYCIFFCMNDSLDIVRVCGVLSQNLTWKKPEPLN